MQTHARVLSGLAPTARALQKAAVRTDTFDSYPPTHTIASDSVTMAMIQPAQATKTVAYSQSKIQAGPCGKNPPKSPRRPRPSWPCELEPQANTSEEADKNKLKRIPHCTATTDPVQEWRDKSLPFESDLSKSESAGSGCLTSIAKGGNVNRVGTARGEQSPSPSWPYLSNKDNTSYRIGCNA